MNHHRGAVVAVPSGYRLDRCSLLSIEGREHLTCVWVFDQSSPEFGEDSDIRRMKAQGP
jgi:hypothetical protein